MGGRRLAVHVVMSRSSAAEWNERSTVHAFGHPMVPVASCRGYPIICLAAAKAGWDTPGVGYADGRGADFCPSVPPRSHGGG